MGGAKIKTDVAFIDTFTRGRKKKARTTIVSLHNTFPCLSMSLVFVSILRRHASNKPLILRLSLFAIYFIPSPIINFINNIISLQPTFLLLDEVLCHALLYYPFIYSSMFYYWSMFYYLRLVNVILFSSLPL